jgi:ABC-type antimicrobial peptide transport system permease subunit
VDGEFRRPAPARHLIRPYGGTWACRRDGADSDSVDVFGVQRPAQIVNYRTIGSTPVILAIGLAAGAVGALGLTLAASVRRRRRDLALLKTLGFTQGQLAAAVAWQATTAAFVGIVIGMPLGIIMGRQLWSLFAENLNAVPDPTVPALSLVLVGVGAFVFANLVAAPARAGSGADFDGTCVAG